jgi:phosphoglycolate phosphatase
MSKRPPAPTIVFDLDGTLVDTVDDIAAAFDLAIAPYGRSPTSREVAASLMGEGLSGFFWRGLVAHRLNLPAEEAADVYRQFLVAYRRTPVKGSRAYPGIPQLLEEIREAGAHTAVCTNKVEDIAMDILVRLELRPLFDAVVGHYGDRPKKPDPLTLLEAITRAGGSRTNALMIGDTAADSGAAVAAGIPAILVSYGYSHFAIRAVRTDVHVDSVEELRAEILRFIAPGERRAWSWAYR